MTAAAIPDTAYWREQIKCQSACPVNTDARGYIRAIAEGKEELAYLIARGPNPLASICGRVCGAPCEKACRRGDIDDPVAIRSLKRYVCEQFGPESRADGGKTLVEFLTDAAKRYGPRECSGQNEFLPLMQSLMRGDIPKVEHKSVGVIGSGPAGLAAAHDLALLGFSVTIYEMESVLAGMLAFGIPEYRLPRDLIRAEVEVITSLGVEAITNCKVGEDISFPELRAKHDAVIIAVGAKCSRKLPIPGADAQGVIGGVEFLREVSLGNTPKLGERVVVIGGGNVAYDVGRTVVRQIAIDAARTAKLAGVGEVHLCSLESLDEMPADDVEIIEGDEEGLLRKNSLGPTEVLVENGKVVGVRFQKCLRVFDEHHRFNPLFDADDITDIPCDTVLISIGQGIDIAFLDAERDNINISARGLIECDPVSGASSAPDVFIAGDLAYGPKLLIHGVASGKAVARAIYEQTTGRALRAEEIAFHVPIPRFSREQRYEGVARQKVGAIPVAQRLASQDALVEVGLTATQARCEAGRCLDCGVNTIFDGMKCILCGGCAEVCPVKCLQLIPLVDLIRSGQAGDAISAQLDDFPAAQASAITKDETMCIRCALCAERCPTGAITMERFQFSQTMCVAGS